MYQEPYLQERMATAVYAREMAAAFFGGVYHPRAEALYHRVLNDNQTFEAWRDYRRKHPTPRVVVAVERTNHYSEHFTA